MVRSQAEDLRVVSRLGFVTLRFCDWKKGTRSAKEQSFLFGVYTSVLALNPAPDYDCHVPSGHMGMPGSAGNMGAGREALGMLLAVCQRVALFVRVIRVTRVLS